MEEVPDELETSIDPLVKVFRAEGILTKSKEMIMLTDEELSCSLDYIFKKTTEEVLKFNDKKVVEKRLE